MKYKLVKADLWGNDEDGYDWNDSYSCGVYDIPDHFFESGIDDTAFIKLLCSIGVFDNQALKAETIDIDIQSDGIEETFYIDFYFKQNYPTSKESYSLQPVV